MSMISSFRSQATPARTALAAGVVALGALTLDGSAPVGALEAPAARPQFETVAFADVIEQVQPAVVEIDVTKRPRGVAQMGGQGAPFPENSPFGEFMRRFAPPGGAPVPQQGVGSGFIIDAEGHVVTNNHVIEGAETMSVTLNDGKEYEARLVGHDPLTDLALLRIDGAADVPSIAFGDSDSVRVGDWVVAIGSPFGFGGSASAGIVSARGRDIRSGPYDDFLQVDAPINSGSSGGPIIDASGRVVGVNTAIFSPTGGNVGIGFAIPANDARRIVEELKAEGTVTRGWLGVQIQDVSADVAEALRLEHARGALVAAVVDASPAERSGVEVGDVIVRFGDTDIVEPRDLSRAVAAAEPGAKIALEVVRRGDTERLSAVIDRNDQQQQQARAGGPAGGGEVEDPLGLGLALGALDAQARRKLQLDADVSGAVVLGVKSGGAADAGGIRPGDVIVQVDQRNVSDTAEAERALRAARQQERPAVVLIRRSGEQFFTTLKVA